MSILNDNRMFGDIFKELRLEKCLSQDKIAEDLDVSQGLITKWESHQSTPSPEMLDYIADYFTVSTDYLIGRTYDRTFYKKTKENTELDVLYSKTKDILSDEDRDLIKFSMQRAIDRYEEEKNKRN